MRALAVAAALSALVTPAHARDPAPVDSAACRDGFVQREARPGDTVCVSPASHARVRQENATYERTADPGGAYGLASCAPGLVWREAFEGDIVCVTPAVRALVREENARAGERRR